jgi:hypothetical protein
VFHQVKKGLIGVAALTALALGGAAIADDQLVKHPGTAGLQGPGSRYGRTRGHGEARNRGSG